MCEKCKNDPCRCQIKAGLHVEVAPALDDEQKAVARALEFTISSEIVDRDQEVISFDGWDLKNYKKNPVVLFGHNYSIPPVAKAVRIWKSTTDRKLKAKVVFPEPEVSSLSDTLYRLYKDGFMSAVSVGFLPKKIDHHSGTERGKEDPWRTYLKQELLEFSLVPVPANPEALITSRSLKSAFEAGCVDKYELDELMIYLKQVIDEDESEPTVAEIISQPIHLDAYSEKRTLMLEVAGDLLSSDGFIDSLAERVVETIRSKHTEPTIYDELLPLLRSEKERSANEGDLFDQAIETLKLIKEG